MLKFLLDPTICDFTSQSRMAEGVFHEPLHRMVEQLIGAKATFELFIGQPHLKNLSKLQNRVLVMISMTCHDEMNGIQWVGLEQSLLNMMEMLKCF